MSNADERVGADKRRPARSSPTYAVRAPVARWLEQEAVLAHERIGPLRVLDVGCGVKPYLPFFEPYAREYVGVDIDNPLADLEGAVEALPVDDASFDVVLCVQVLEHCGDPAKAVSELRRVTGAGGRVLASTHGVQVYHPAPDDFWRWTHAGLERLFAQNGEWSALSVRPGSGIAACMSMLIATYVDLLAARAHLRRPARAVVVRALNAAADTAERRFPSLAASRPGALAANYHVTAEVAR